MKYFLALFGIIATTMAVPTVGSAATLTWNFLNDVSSASTGVAVAAPHSFADAQSDGTIITASIVSNLENQKLFEKKAGGDENGLGIYGLSDNEIGTSSKVKLDLSNVLALNPGSISITLDSVQSSEGGFVQYGASGDGFNVSDESAHALDLQKLLTDGGYVEVYATSANVLVGDIAATTAPEPANAALVGLGFLVAMGCIRRKIAQSKA